jgi:replicative DNA helicase
MINLEKYTNQKEEQIVLGSLIMKNSDLQKVSDILKMDHFRHDSNQRIYEEILNKVNKYGVAADIITLRSFFSNLPEGIEYLNHLASIASVIIPIRDYAFNLRELSEKRDLLFGFHEIIDLLETKSPDEIVSKVQDLISSIDSESSEVEIFDGDSMEQSLLDGWRDGSSNIIMPSGIKKLDDMLNGGFTIDKLYTIGAAPGTGKTSFAQQVIINALEKEYGVLFVSMEMERKNVFSRFLANFSSINPFRIIINNIFNHEQDRFEFALKKWQGLKSNYFMTEKGHLTLESIEKTLKRKLKTNPIKLIVVDYIQIMQLRDSRNMSEASLIKDNVRGLKDIATKYGVAVIALSQITKNALGEKPGLKSLKGSGGIGEDSDCVINLWTDSEETEQKKIKTVNVEVAKNRNGAQGSLVINFDGEFNKFTENNF